MFHYACPLRWSDVDAQGHVNNAVIVDYLQEARVAFLRSGAASSLLDSGVVVVAHQVEYNRPVEYDDQPLTVELGVSAVGASRIEVAYRLVQRDHTCVHARTVLCAFDFESQAPVRLTDSQRQFFRSHATDVAALRAVEAPSLGGRGTPVPVTVRWSDLDSYGHVNNAMFFDYVQQARVEATTTWDPTMARAGAPGNERLWLVVRQDVDYLAQLPHRISPYTAFVAPTKLGSSSLTLSTELSDVASGIIFARARTVLVSADATGTPLELGNATRSRLERHLVH